MLCAACARLAQSHGQKTCLRCQATIYSTLTVLCEPCSSTNRMCAVCLKKMPDLKTVAIGNRKIGCNSCGRG